MKLRFLPFVLLAALLTALPASAQIQPFAYWVPPSACATVVSGNSTGTNGQTTVGASTMPVVQAQTSVTGTNTHTYICNIAPPASLSVSGTRIQIIDAVFFYATQPQIGTQAASLSAGTMNSSIVFSYVNYPVPGASETASTVTPVRADSGSLTIAPAVASFNVTTTTAGSFYSAKFTPAALIGWNTDLKQLLLTVTLQGAATTALITNSPGILVHARSQ